MVSSTFVARKGLCAIAMAVAICPFLFLDLNLDLGGHSGGHSSSSNNNERRLRETSRSFTNAAPAAAPPGVLLAGLVEDVKNVSPSTIDFLVELSCQSHVVAHVFASKGVEDLRKSYKERSTRNGMRNCADFFVEQDEADLDRAYPNRIDRLSHVRDMQRELLESFYEAHSVDNYKTPAAKDGDKFHITKPFEYVIVIDLDLHRTPTPSDVLHAIQYLDEGAGSSMDAICANGLTLDGKLPYDSYATVLLPDTFLGYFLRSDPTLMPNEDPSAVDTYIEATTNAGSTKAKVSSLREGWPFVEWIKSIMSRFSDSDLLLVKSCFGGMAIYRTDAWFANECKYTSDYTSDHVRYIAAGTGRVCEHVVFNHCLRNKYKADFSMAVHRGLVANYHQADPEVIAISSPNERGLKPKSHGGRSIFSNPANPSSSKGKKLGQTERGINHAISQGNPYAKKYGFFDPSPSGRKRVHGHRNLKARLHQFFFSTAAADPSSNGKQVGQKEKGINHAIAQGNPYAKKYGLFEPTPPGRKRVHGH